ncbi:uncharacterized protein EV420DRAFT_1644219 [Desarmillaria tabescens]|uniref:DUF6533 domain-containing protein n=1 Tax=Armillaria tabescens TaxID=1929756 RepID=A0AA39K9J0_ARMTA|nr:uncharacterized protein EV420DRAFT_1644219 [Desarmillaria tabescens]KAK0457072.1 hypothetical protein EV420DRAFT_1644219 [Desarmillaria tabescens]
MNTDAEDTKVAALYRESLVPLYVVPASFTWILHDYFVMLEDEIRYIWPQKRNIGKIIFLWVRYYSIALLVVDTLQIHIFSILGINSDKLCVAAYTIISVFGAISLWSVEIVMQLRVYVLFTCSKRVAVINGILFACSVVGFLWISAKNAEQQKALIADAIHLPLLGCPIVHPKIEWAQWVPGESCLCFNWFQDINSVAFKAAIYESVLFGFAIYKSFESMMDRMRRGHSRDTLRSILLRDNTLYFLGISCLLVFNNLMIVGVDKLPRFSYGPFHAALGVLTTRMLLNLHNAASSRVEVSSTGRDVPDHQQGSLPWQVASVPSLSLV